MRWVICALGVLLLAPKAFAGDFDMLRGSQPVGPANFTNWSGLYVGGQFGYSDVNADFSASTAGPLAYALRESAVESEFGPSQWPVLGTADHAAKAYGGFIGYNSQWQDLILGIEGNYNHASVSLFAPNTPIARITPVDANNNSYLVALTASGTQTNLDYATVRGRAGWIVGNFLPYGFAGIAVGRADVNITATVQGEENPPAGGGACVSPCSPFSFTGVVGKNPGWLYGFTLGGGLDVALTRNIFLRAEYEYLEFLPLSGVHETINTARIGAGLKF